MALITCKECGQEISSSAKKCPQCGAKNKSKNSKQCKECGKDVSTKAKKCPSCGAPLKKKHTVLRTIGLLIFILIVLSELFSSNINTRPPEYVKDIHFQKEGDEGFLIYFILADNSRAMTASDGNVKMTITEKGKELYSFSQNIKKSDFRKAKVGLAAMEHDVLLYMFKRMVYSSFTKKPTSMSGKIIIEFKTPDNKTVKGEEDIFF